MAWQAYVDNLMSDKTCKDCAIVGYEKENKSVWGSLADGELSKIVPQQIDCLVGKERTDMLVNGLTLGPMKCSVIRDGLHLEDDWTMDVRTKSEGGKPTYNISVAKAARVLIIVMGKEGVHGGGLNTKAFKMAKYLKESGY